MREILMSLSPYWYYLIGERIKKIEVRSRIPKDQNWNKKVACYMTKDKKSFNRIPKEFQEKYKTHFGKVGMQFVCNKIDEFEVSEAIFICDPNDIYDVIPPSFDYSKTCLTLEELYSYGNEKTIYGLHISNVKIYDKPKELGEFYKPLKYDEDGVICGTKQEMSNIYEWDCHTLFNVPDNCDCTLLDCPKLREFYKITRPPQSWCYVEEL